jgi:hypothetical protein
VVDGERVQDVPVVPGATVFTLPGAGGRYGDVVMVFDHVAELTAHSVDTTHVMCETSYGSLILIPGIDLANTREAAVHAKAAGGES